MTDILFVSFNRLEFTKASFAALVANTNWDEVSSLFLADDISTDGTREWLTDQIPSVEKLGVPVTINRTSFRGPVGATLWYLKQPNRGEDKFFKLDNDFVVPPGWLDEVLRVAYLHPGVDFVGLQPRYGPPTPGRCDDRRIEEAKHIGGIGLMRHRAFEVCHPIANGRYGFTEWQCRHPENRKGWLFPDLAGFCLDLIDLEPWASLGTKYEAAGWQRPWSKYVDGGRSYYEWWAK